MNNSNNKLQLLDLPKIVILKIVLFLTNTDDYNNLRISNKFFYFLLNTIKKFNNNICIQEIVEQYNKLYNTIYYPNRKIKLKNIFYYENYSKYRYKIDDEKEYYENGNMKRISHYKNGNKHGIENIF